MRSKKAIINVGVTLSLRLVAIVAGLIVPQLIINNYGSSTNGLIVSITQFMGYIVLLEAGVGGVVRAALYKPLAQREMREVTSILKESEIFFRKIAYIFLVYILALGLIYPRLVSDEFEVIYTISLLLIIGISVFFQYYFGITYQILLYADQRQYVISFLQIVTLIINTLMTIILIKFDFTIHLVLLISSIGHVIRPLVLYYYVKKSYELSNFKEVSPQKITQKWDGIGHHLAFLIHNNTDVAILTIFTDIKEVSVYSIYFLIISSVQSITITFASGVEASFGNMIAKREIEALRKNFKVYEFITFTITTILFTSLFILILPFVNLYTEGVDDVNYYRPLFAYTLIFAGLFYCIRLPYNSVTLAAGHYKETKRGALLEAIINVSISVILVNYYGIVGVAVGTLIAMLFRTLQYVHYSSKFILISSPVQFYKNLFLYFLTGLITILTINTFDYEVNDYGDWILYAILTGLISSIFTSFTGLLFYFSELKYVIYTLKRVFKK